MKEQKVFVLLKLFFVIEYCLSCENDEFPCYDGQCIKKISWCDTKVDCNDMSDEALCKEAYENEFGKILNDPNTCSNNTKFFLCRTGTCIPIIGRCDGVDSCTDGSDELNCDAVSNLDNIRDAEDETSLTEDIIDSDYFQDLRYVDFRDSLRSARNWLLSQQDQNFGWGDYTQRAVVALALSDTPIFPKQDKELLMEKQLQIQLSISLARNQSNVLPLTELALCINALVATCNNPRNFHGFDLVTILRERVNAVLLKSTFVSPLVFLTLCMNNETAYNDMYALQGILRLQNKAFDQTDLLSLASLASSCHQRAAFSVPQYHRNIILSLMSKIERFGLPGNIYEMSLVVQALNEARVDPRKWKREEAMEFVLNHQNENGSFGDILATYYVLPILSGKSLASLATHCDKDFSKGLIPLEILKNSKKEKIKVHYSLFFGNPIQMTQKIELKVSKGTNFLDVMRLAQEENINFRFKLDDTRSLPFVYSIGGVPNDAERGLFWSLHISNPRNTNYIPYNKDIRSHIPIDDEETVFWLRPL